MEINTTSMALVQTNPLNNRIHGPSRTPSSGPVGGIHGSLGTRWFPELKGQCVRTGNLTCLFSPLFGCGFGALVGVRPLPSVRVLFGSGPLGIPTCSPCGVMLIPFPQRTKPLARAAQVTPRQR